MTTKHTGSLELNLHFKNHQPPRREDLIPIMKKFLADMDADRSRFFHEPELSNWSSELEAIQKQASGFIKGFQSSPQSQWFHLGIGGSSLGAEVLIRSLCSASISNRFHFLDNIDPDALAEYFERFDPKQCFLYVVTKSGTTAETLAQFLLFWNWLEKNLGREQALEHVVFCTDPTSGNIRALAQQWRAPCFSIPQNLGGRYSVLSSVGFFPAWIAGLQTEALQEGAKAIRTVFLQQWADGKIPPILELAWVYANQASKKPISVLMPYSEKLRTLGSWWTQLWAESLGKNGQGLTPLMARGATDQHSVLQLLSEGPQDKIIGFIECLRFKNRLNLPWARDFSQLSAFEELKEISLYDLFKAELDSTREVLCKQNPHCFSLLLPELNEKSLGELFFFFQLLTALAGYCMNLNPFDQPGVEEGKILTKKRIQKIRSME